MDALVAELQDQKIEQQMASTRGDIYASIIHDINGPLAVISGFVQLLNHRVAKAERLENEDLEFVRQKLHTISRQVGNCVEISQRYLSFLRRNPGEISRVSVNTLLNDFEHLARVHPSRKENELVVKPVVGRVHAAHERHRLHPDAAQPDHQRLPVRGTACRVEVVRRAAVASARPRGVQGFCRRSG